MQKIRFAVALLAFTVLGYAIGSGANPDPHKWQAVVLLMPVSGEGIITGVVKKFIEQEDCEKWLKKEMRELHLNRAFRSSIDPIGKCNGR